MLQKMRMFYSQGKSLESQLGIFQITVPQIASKDKDFRYMATSDLLNELQKDNFKLDSDTERKVSQIVLQQLDDASGDISGLAVKWFAISILFWNSFCSLFTKCCANECW
jgi:hypothetical protein